MKLNADKIEIETEGFASTGFGVDVNDPAVIQILTEGIYNDPWIWPRELLANAADAGGAVELVLPDSLTPEWSIQDHGPGMTDEFMGNGYTRIFNSTKRGDNNMIGGFGHGRLSPLAYTDSYTVRSRFLHEGRVMEGNYVVFKGEDKVPRITRVSLGLSDVQQTGVTVVIPIAQKDTSRINARTRFYASYSKPTPVGFTAAKYQFVGSTGAIRSPEVTDVPEFSGTRVIMGGVPYPAPTSLYNRGVALDLFFAVGELDPTLSRDSIKNNDATSKLITERFNTLIKEYKAEILKDVEKETTLLDKYTKWMQIRNKLDYSLQNLVMSGRPDIYLSSKTVLDSIKGDFSIQSLRSDINRHSWDGMDEETKAFKSLSGLKVFMLTSGGQIQRRDGVDGTPTDNINLTDWVMNQGMSSYGLNMIMFAVPMPYAPGQIKHVRGAMAKKIAELRLAKKINNNVGICLIQYENKADAQTIADLISKKIDIQFIDDKTVSATATRYIPAVVLPADSGRINRKAISSAVLATKVANTAYIVANGSFYDINSLLDYTRRTSPLALKDKELIAVTKANEKYLPAGAILAKDVVLEDIKSNFGYPYDRLAFEKLDIDARKNRKSVNLSFLSEMIGPKDHTLGENLYADPRIKARADIFPAIELLEKIKEGSGGYGEPLSELIAKLGNIEQLIEFGLFTKDELPDPSKPMPTPQTGDMKVVDDFKKKYILLPALTNLYRYDVDGYPSDLYEHVVNYLLKI